MFQLLAFSASLLLIICALYYFSPAKWRSLYLLIISYAFYAFVVKEYAILLAISTLITYFAGRYLVSVDNKFKRKLVLYLSLILHFGLLFYFKYETNFGDSTLLHSIILPVGMSFYMFRATGYILDIYNQTRLESENNFITYALYVSFFPTLLSGPIQNSAELIPQIKATTSWSWSNFEKGLRNIIVGLFLKLVIADNLASIFFPLYLSVNSLSVAEAWFVTLGFPIQLYADFLGYSLLAIGCANLLGFNISPNFDKPFLADSIPAFWRRWHISLTNWMNDYIFSPLSIALRNWNIWGVAIASSSIFIIVGIWHGGTVNYLLFGAVHAICVATAVLLQRSRKKFEKKHGLKENKIYCSLRIITTYLIVSFSFIFFRTSNFAEAIALFKHLFVSTQVASFTWSTPLIAAAVATLLVVIYEVKEEYFPKSFQPLNSSKIYYRIISYSILLAAIALWGSKVFLNFIYFRF